MLGGILLERGKGVVHIVTPVAHPTLQGGLKTPPVKILYATPILSAAITNGIVNDLVKPIQPEVYLTHKFQFLAGTP